MKTSDDLRKQEERIIAKHPYLLDVDFRPVSQSGLTVAELTRFLGGSPSPGKPITGSSYASIPDHSAWLKNSIFGHSVWKTVAVAWKMTAEEIIHYEPWRAWRTWRKDGFRAQPSMFSMCSMLKKSE